MKIGWLVGAVFFAIAGAFFQVALWSTTGDGSAPVIVQGICNVTMGLMYLGVAGFCLLEARE